ncbi:phosphatase PAP2 family protein [Virgibacillus halophilus]|uniref:Phosphatase PAP2 family protein n=1 Tax=Tigheibacillus halophilus TaxID=361280 RepID=A0ABU5C7C9_9BACI|nr:phosphatase PAP2 family protein [Virgibacillus halophilus]
MTTKRKILSLFLLLIFPVFAVIYNYLNDHVGTATELKTFADNYIPVIPGFVIPYILWYGFVFFYLVYYCFKNTKVYFFTVATIAVGEILCFTCYYLFQTTVTRPELHGNGLFTLMLQQIYEKDNPYNCFPSIHVLTTYAVMLASIQVRNKHLFHTIVIHVLGTLIILSTLFTKQHVFLDVAASMLIVSVIYSLLSIVFSMRSFVRAQNKNMAWKKKVKGKTSVQYMKSEK